MIEQIESADAEIDLTPMLDVVFIMLIFFIVTASFVNEIGIDLPKDDSQPKTANAKESLVIKIDSDNRYYVNRKYTDRRALLNYLAGLHAEAPDKSIVIIPDLSASSDALVFVLDTGRVLGVQTSISLPVPDA